MFECADHCLSFAVVALKSAKWEKRAKDVWWMDRVRTCGTAILRDGEVEEWWKDGVTEAIWEVWARSWNLNLNARHLTWDKLGTSSPNWWVLNPLPQWRFELQRQCRRNICNGDQRLIDGQNPSFELMYSSWCIALISILYDYLTSIWLASICYVRTKSQ